MHIWALNTLPSLEEVQPEPALLTRAAEIPLTSQTEMQRSPGQRSYCHKIGQGCGGPQHRQAWEEFRTELDHDDLQAMARHFVEDQCRDLTPERRAASAQFVLLLVTTGLELLRGVAVLLHSLEVEQCWAWDLNGERPGETYTAAWCVKRVLSQILHGMTRSGWVPDVSNRALGGYDCCARHEGCLEYFALVAGRRERWYSLAPCMHWVCYACYPQAMGAQVREARERARAAASEAAAAASDALNAAMAVAISDRHQAADIFVAVAADAEARAARADQFRGDDPVCPCCGAHVRSAFSASLAAGRAGALAASTSAS